MGHKTGSRANFEKMSRQKLRLKKMLTCAKFKKKLVEK